MPSPLACVVCSLDPQTTSLVLPLAQATIIAAPVILRKQIAKGVQSVRARRSRRTAPGSLAVGHSRSAASPGCEVEGER
jgi:hypothetical protein